MQTSGSHPAIDVRYVLLTGGHWPDHWLFPYVFISEWLVSGKETEIMKKILRFGSAGNGRPRRLRIENTAAASQRARALSCPYGLLPGPWRIPEEDLGGDLLQSPPFAFTAM